MSASVLLNLFNELSKSDKMRGLPSIYRFFAASFINSITQEYKYKITLNILRNRNFGVKTSSF